MKLKYNINTIFWLLAAVLAVLLFFELKYENSNSKESVLSRDISELVEDLKQESQQIFEKILPAHFNEESAQKAYELKTKRWYLITSEKGKLNFWNSNKFGLDSVVFKRSDYPLFYTFGDDFYVLFSRDSSAYLAFRLANDWKLSQRVISKYPGLNGYELASKQNIGKISKVQALDFTLNPKENSKAWIVLLLLFVVLLYLFFANFKKGNYKQAISISLLLILLDVLTQYVLQHSKLSLSTLYQPSIYASSDILSSLGTLLNHIIISIPLVYLFREYFKSKTVPFWLNGFSVLLSFFATDLVLGIIEGLVLDSNISFNFQALYGISIYTFIALSSIGLMLFALFLFILSSSLKENIKSRNTYWPIVVGLLIFVLFQMVDGRRSFTSLLLPIVFTLIVPLINTIVNSQRPKIIAFFFFGVLVSSVQIILAQQSRENRYIKLYASKLISNQDLRAEYILKSFEDQLAEEFLVPEDYENFASKKDVVENRIKRLYFSNYLEKYELRLISFDSLGVNINENTLYNYKDLDRVYNENTKRTVSNYFYQINNPTLISGYIAKYENCDLNGHYGATFILLQPRLIQSDFLYPEAFANQEKKELINVEEYAYAIYFKKRLISQKGSFNYSLNEPPRHKEQRWDLHFNDYHHYYYDDIEDFQVILSKKENSLSQWLSAVTFNFLLLIPLTVLLVLLAYFYDPEESSFLILKGKFLSTRIQVSVTLILLVGLLLSVYIIINYISSNYNARLEKELLGNVKNISARFQNKVDLERKLKNVEQRQLILNEESSAYKVDLNLFDANGRLLSTTKPYLIKEEVLGDLMNPKAFEKMHIGNYSQLLLQEELEGSDYLSAYVPLFNGKNEVIGYLNIPYFAKNEELNQQISTVIVNIINIYFLLLLGGTLLALFISKRISKPLLLIRQRFAETELGVKNELIVYQRDDEIGQLVKQYNKMVLELEASAERLAETEREGAWREMAKQVAHEIKNPLTPMKLSIQHLQRAYAQGGEKVDALFERTSKLLIEQIDSLSNMASEFSSFAKMPEDEYVAFDLSEALETTVELFKRSENVVIRKSIESGILVFADPEQIKRVFNNLIKNGIQAIPEDKSGLIEVKLHSQGRFAICEVKDNGKGISKENRAKVFVPNFSTKTSGMGLGLAISRKIVETAKGSINFTSEVDKGTTFIVKLPIYEK